MKTVHRNGARAVAAAVAPVAAPLDRVPAPAPAVAAVVLENGHHRDDRQAAPAGTPTTPTGAAFFTLSRAECEALHREWFQTTITDPLARAVLRRMTEMLHG